MEIKRKGITSFLGFLKRVISPKYFNRKKERKMSENVVFGPSKEQIKFLDIYLRLEKKTNKEIAKEIKVTDRTIYRWFNDQKFVDWINSNVNMMLKKTLLPRYRTAIWKALAGDFSFSKLLFEIQGEYVPKSESKIIHEEDPFADLSDEEKINKIETNIKRYRDLRGRTKSAVN